MIQTHDLVWSVFSGRVCRVAHKQVYLVPNHGP